MRATIQKMNIGETKQQLLETSRASKEIGDGGEADNDAASSEAAAAAAAVMAAERSAARIERMGYDVGYRLCERLAQHRPLLGPGSPSPESGATDAASTSLGLSNEKMTGNNIPIIMGGGGHNTIMDPKSKMSHLLFHSQTLSHLSFVYGHTFAVEHTT